MDAEIRRSDPSTSDPKIVARASAVPCPFAAGISAIRQPGALASSPVNGGLASAAIAAGWALA